MLTCTLRKYSVLFVWEARLGMASSAVTRLCLNQVLEGLLSLSPKFSALEASDECQKVSARFLHSDCPVTTSVSHSTHTSDYMEL